MNFPFSHRAKDAASPDSVPAKKPSAIKRFFWYLLFVAAVVAACFWLFFHFIGGQRRTFEEMRFVITEGEGVAEIGAELENVGLISHDFYFSAYSWWVGSEGRFQAGVYTLSPNSSLREIVYVLARGAANANEVRVTFPEGLRADEMEKILVDNGIVTAGAFVDGASVASAFDYDFLQGVPKEQGLEGYLFPDTYFFFTNTGPDAVVIKMLDTFKRKAADVLQNFSAPQSLTSHEIMTLASIVEGEVQTPVDKAKVSGVFFNRFEIGMPLQSDATVEFATGKQGVNPAAGDLDVDSPYNTYKYAGLPPGPINNPGLDSIRAVLNPEPSDFFYFLTTDEDEVIYAKTFEEHKVNIAKYL